MPFNKKIGLLGGAGPWASAHAAVTIVQKAQWDYRAIQDDDYPEFVLRSVPLKGFGAKGIEDKNLVRRQLIEQFNRFAQDGIEVAVMACNSLHTFHSELQGMHPNMRIVNLPEEGTETVVSHGCQTVGVLCSESALDDNLHRIALEAKGIKVVLPSQDQQARINHLIYRVMGGNTGAEEAQIFRQLSREYGEAGAQVLLSGCTELSYLSHKFQSDVPVIDCLYVSIAKAMKLAWDEPA
jgi:aspartate racemase